ncbi:hypothetical protein POTG_01733 [Paenibacillus sp. oral taxon 786 str. D14]|uniref:hypothetical protein n=1 Tax=Paenibacillus sp. oral taxon 786 TaxID=652715 RepID=UPI0001AFD278|nr:hypothetical protein [Paenibacillus sp. oral taxon 786]EES73438.1 hypothetical protein POTG_01733 [Paenibacillus sp. oral taxon 786 str. D14]
MFEKFGDYMYHLLFGPLKKVAKAKNQLYIFLKVIGKLADQTKQDILRVREESMIISASELMLEQHGQERGMRRLKGESVENYRMRLMMKHKIAELAGTEQGILLSLRMLGYEQSYIEPYRLYDPERWAEFIIYLAGKNPSGVNDIAVIDSEVMKVKPASGKPSYAVEEQNRLMIRSAFQSGYSGYALCNTFACGTWPTQSNFGSLAQSDAAIKSQFAFGQVQYPLADTIRASEKLYQPRGG